MCAARFLHSEVDVHFETDLHLGLLILLHLLDHRNLSSHGPGDLGNIIDDLQLRNLHCFWLLNLFHFHSCPCLLCRWHLRPIS